MNTKLLLPLIFIFFLSGLVVRGQDYTMNTIFSSGKPRASGGYGAITDKFTTINGHFTNLVEVYGGWYVNHRFLLGFAIAGVTNNLPVAPEFSAKPGTPLSYEYGHAGLMTEYTLWSGRAVHFGFQLFTGGGFTMQYERHPTPYDTGYDYPGEVYDEDWFFVAEPGAQLEMNVFKWMRVSPGISYRAAFNSSAMGLSDDALSAMSYNVTLKFGKF